MTNVKDRSLALNSLTSTPASLARHGADYGRDRYAHEGYRAVMELREIVAGHSRAAHSYTFFAAALVAASLAWVGGLVAVESAASRVA